MPVPIEARQALVSRLRRAVTRLEHSSLPEDDRPVSAGSSALDRLLPQQGLKRGTLVEYLSAAAGGGAGILALAAAREACRQGRAFVALDCQRQFYPPAAAAWGIDLSGTLVLRPKNEADALWALDQALRCPGVGAVWAPWNRLEERDFRRLQLAAEAAGRSASWCVPARRRGHPSWADVQWLVAPVGQASRLPGEETGDRRQGTGNRGQRLAGRADSAATSRLLSPVSCFPSLASWLLRVELVRCRGTGDGKVVLLELDETAGIWREAANHATHSLPALAEVAYSKAARRAVRVVGQASRQPENRRSEVRDQKPEVGGQKAKIGGRRSVRPSFFMPAIRGAANWSWPIARRRANVAYGYSCRWPKPRRLFGGQAEAALRASTTPVMDISTLRLSRTIRRLIWPHSPGWPSIANGSARSSVGRPPTVRSSKFEVRS